MIVTNKTNYDTQYLKRLFQACEDHIFQTYLIHGERKDRWVEVRYKRKNGVGGYAWLKSRRIVILLAKPHNLFGGVFICPQSRRLAQVYLHEVGHNIGLVHRQMVRPETIKVDWLPDEALPLAPVKEKPKVDVQLKRYQEAQKHLAQWEHKLKLAKTYVKKYQKKVKYYEAKAAACK